MKNQSDDEIQSFMSDDVIQKIEFKNTNLKMKIKV